MVKPGKKKVKRKHKKTSTSEKKLQNIHAGVTKSNKNVSRFLKKAAPKLIPAVLSVSIIVLLVFAFQKLFMSKTGELSIKYPFDGSVFPREIISPEILWEDRGSDADSWRIIVGFEDDQEEIVNEVDTTIWIPDRDIWDRIKENSLEKTATITVESFVKFAGISRTLSSQSVAFSTSSDSVGAPIFFRDVPIPFGFALRNLTDIKWRLGDISSYEQPDLILENLPVCGNCHSFSADGRTLGMDVDVSNDKGAYVLTEFKENTTFSTDKIFSWYDHYEDRSVPTFGLLARVSPCGWYVVGGMQDRALFVARDDLYSSQLFFPVFGHLAFYSRADKKIYPLPGADDKNYVQCNAVWSADGQYITFARSPVPKLKTKSKPNSPSLSHEEAAELLGGRQYLFEAKEGAKKFRYDLYKVPFNMGKGGEPVPVKGASNNGKSNYFPKYSPDGKWLVFNQSDSYMLLQVDSKLHIMPAEGGEPRLMNCNTDRMNSWHSWSPNSKWLVFSSKAFSPYTQLFLTHIDENGNDSPPVLLRNFAFSERAANIPEFVNIDPKSRRKINERFLNDYSHYRVASFYTQFGQMDRAEEEYKKSIEMNPDNAPSHLSLGKMYRERRELYKAESELKAVLKIEPENEFAYLTLCDIYADRKEFGKAEKAYEEFLKRDNINPDFMAGAHFSIGMCCFYSKNYEKAEREFRKALEIDPQHFNSHISIGNIYLRKGDIKNALPELEKALKIFPDSPNLKKKIDELRKRIG
ncbi:MAG: tetratricopeptide repeat protein [bacterium]|nr:tetratricopeptide repeat protein [bacterium]